ncbi:MAG: endospore germination permease [Syntrophomonas sp.]
MKDKAGSMISSKQLIFVIIGAQFGLGVFSLPRVVSEAAHKDAWIAVILGAVIPIVSLYLIERLGKRMPELNFTQMTTSLFGKYIGAFLIILFIAYVIAFESIVVRIYAEVTKLYLLPQTPLTVVLAMYIFTIIYIGNKGARVLGRVNEIMFYMLLVSFMVLLLPLGQTDYTNLLPVGEAGLGGIARGALSSAYYFAGTEVLLVFYTLVIKKDEVIKAGLTAIGITTALYCAMVIIGELVFGTHGLQGIIWPGLVLLKVAQLPVIERLEFVFLFVWLGTGVRPAINMGFVAALSLSQLFKIDEKKYHVYSLIFVGMAIFILARLPHDALAAFKLADYAGYGFLVIGLGYPLLYHLSAFLRGGVKMYV